MSRKYISGSISTAVDHPLPANPSAFIAHGLHPYRVGGVCSILAEHIRQGHKERLRILRRYMAQRSFSEQGKFNNIHLSSFLLQRQKSTGGFQNLQKWFGKIGPQNQVVVFNSNGGRHGKRFG